MRHAGHRALLGVVMIVIAASAILGLAVTRTEAVPGRATYGDTARQAAAAAPAAPRTAWLEDFENVPGDWQLLTTYRSTDGVAYTASAYWASAVACNGMVARVVSVPPGDSPCPTYNDGPNAQQLVARWLAAVATGAPSEANHALAWYSFDGPPAPPYTPGEAVIATLSGVPVGQGGRFLQLTFDAAGTNCQGRRAVLSCAASSSTAAPATR